MTQRKNNWNRMLLVEYHWRQIRRLRREITRAVSAGEPLTSPRLHQLDDRLTALGQRAFRLERVKA